MKYITTVLSIIILTALVGWLGNLPQDAGDDVPQGKLNSLSFAPYREGQGPLDKKFPSAEQVEADLRLLSEKTYSIRTYASAEGTMPMIPGLACKYGLTMIQGAWLGGLATDNKIETDELIRSANANPDVVKRVIVGNEVLLRGDLEPEQLVKYIRAVKQKVKQPVSYADVWSMYMKYPDLIKEVDFITIHILPYWEDEPIAVSDAPAHIERIYQRVRKEADAISPGKAILIGESGWPSAGKQRGWSVPGVVNEARFIRGLIKVANRNGFDYNIVEAINQSWKYALEGVIGANWGLFSVDRKEVFPLTGKVQENPQWQKGLSVAIVFFLISALVVRQFFQQLPFYYQAGLLLAMQLMAVLLVNQAEYVWYTSYSISQRLFAGIIILVNAALAFLVLHRAYRLLTGQGLASKYNVWLYNLYVLITGFAVFKTFLLAFNGRYISFPIAECWLAVFGILILVLANGIKWQAGSLHQLNVLTLLGQQSIKPNQDRWLGYGLLVTGFSLVFGETWAYLQSRDLIEAHPALLDRLTTSLTYTLVNGQLLVWLVCIVVMALPLVRSADVR